MEIQLTISQSPILPFTTLQQFVSKCDRIGKTPEEMVAQLIEEAVHETDQALNNKTKPGEDEAV